MKYSALLDEYLSYADAVKKRIDGLTAREMNYKPKREGGWTIKEHLIHMADSETNGFIRIKSIIAQPGSECYVMDEDRWTENIRRKNEDVNKYIGLFGSIRRIVYDLLADEPEENWTKDYIVRSYMGETRKLTLLDTLQLYVNHARMHMEYIDLNLREYNDTPTGKK